MVQSSKRVFRDTEKVNSFRKELLQLYFTFKADIEALCKKHDARIDYWYSPSAIHQPKFVIENVGFTADELYREKELSILPAKRRKKTENPNKGLLIDPLLFCR